MRDGRTNDGYYQGNSDEIESSSFLLLQCYHHPCFPLFPYPSDEGFLDVASAINERLGMEIRIFVAIVKLFLYLLNTRQSK